MVIVSLLLLSFDMRLDVLKYIKVQLLNNNKVPTSHHAAQWLFTSSSNTFVCEHVTCEGF